MRMLARGPRGLDVVVARVAREQCRLLQAVARSVVCSEPSRDICLLCVQELAQVCLFSRVCFVVDLVF